MDYIIIQIIPENLKKQFYYVVKEALIDEIKAN